LIATCTTDGGGDERKAAFQLVKDGNDIWCVAHLIQLAIHDSLDNTKKDPPADCLAHREVIRKAHDLVVFILGHRDTLQAFGILSKRKRENEHGAKMWETLVLDNDTRWDTYLMLLERIVYFDAEILALFQDPLLRFPRECILERDEFDLAYAMTLVLNPFREFTKFVQYRNKVTLAYVPKRIDDMIQLLAPGAYAARLEGRHELTLPRTEGLQARLVASLKARFSHLYEPGSLALAAASLLPGPGRLTFVNFPILPATINAMRENMLDDYVALLDPAIPQEEKDDGRAVASACLVLSRRQLDGAAADTDPLRWWPRQAQHSALYDLVKMLLAIPASSADCERSFSSASFTLDARRYRVELLHFRKEHRIRRFITGGTPGETAAGRQLRLARVRALLGHYADLVAARETQNEQ
jgi:hypothetical protein